ncbi:YitT family protein [Spiroplasma endosymbiont of Stenodema calcarata]|uniref:YitT family protein n=1 Tax=Spiroplasma endosymbiont of Stenodema calcarata TaxID=3139328 RepID=UPI003CCB4545
MKNKTTKKDKYEEYEIIKKKIKQAEKLLKNYTQQSHQAQQQLLIKLNRLKTHPDQTKEFKLKLQLEQLKSKEQKMIHQFVNKIVSYEEQLINIEDKLGFTDDVRITKIRNIDKKELIKQETSLELRNYLKKNKIKGYIYIVLAGLICTIAFDYFLSPSKVLPPGLGALGKIFAQYIFPPLNNANINNANLMYYVFYIINNIPLIIFSWIFISHRFTINTIIFMVVQTTFHIILNGIGSYHGIPYINANDFHFLKDLNKITDPAINDLWIFFFGLIAAILNGIAFGFLYIGDACPGGTDFVNNYISRTKKKPVGNVSIIANTILMLITWAMSYAIKTPTPNPSFATYYFSAPFFAAFMAIIICGIVANKVFPRYKNTSLLIISDKPEVIITRLKENGFTHNALWKITNNYNGEYKDNTYMIMITVPLTMFKRITEAILLADNDAIIRAQTTYKMKHMPHNDY